MSLTLATLKSDYLTPRLGLIQKIRGFEQLGMILSSTSVRFSYENWLATPAPIIRVNGTVVTPSAIDNDTGTVTLATALVTGDDVNATYSFQYFSDDTLTDFYNLALSRLNNNPPASSFTFDDSTLGTAYTLPNDMSDYLTSVAYSYALQTILIDLMNQRASIIWRDPVQFGTYLTTIMSSLENYISGEKLTVKSRRGLSPRSVAGGRWKVPAQTSDHNFQAYTTIRS